jgi:cytochrome o ubiquinol oxidase operon protein cyoD
MNDEAGYRRELRGYCAGLGLAIMLTILPTAWVLCGGFSAHWTLIGIMLLVFLQIIVHLRFFLHVGLQRSDRDLLWLVTFSALIMLLMVGGTLIVYFDQMARM